MSLHQDMHAAAALPPSPESPNPPLVPSKDNINIISSSSSLPPTSTLSNPVLKGGSSKSRMGSSQSKSTPTTPTTPSAATKPRQHHGDTITNSTLNTTTTTTTSGKNHSPTSGSGSNATGVGGINLKLKRAVNAVGGGGRRKKTEDAKDEQSQSQLHQQRPATTTTTATNTTASTSALLSASLSSTSQGVTPVFPVPVVTTPPISPPPRPPPKADTSMPSNGNSNRNSSMLVISPGISSAVTYMLEQTVTPLAPVSPLSPALPPVVSPMATSPPPASSSSPNQNQNQIQKEKESWRKSDSTNSHRTVRAGPSRGSRPVSWAESFQSAYTVVPGSNGGGSSNGHGSKRRSTLLDSEFVGMREEPEGDGSPTKTTETNPHPPVRSRSHNRRSMSLTLGSTSTTAGTAYPASAVTTMATATAVPVAPSYSFSEGVKPSHLPPTPMRTAQPSPPQTPPGGLKGRFAAWTTGIQTADVAPPLVAVKSTTAPSMGRGTAPPPVAASASTASMLNARQERSLPALPPLSPQQQQQLQRQQQQGGVYIVNVLPPGAAPPPTHRQVVDSAFSSSSSRGEPVPIPQTPSSPRHLQPRGLSISPASPAGVSTAGAGGGGASNPFRQTAISMSTTAGTAAGLAKRAVEKVQRKWGFALSGGRSNHQTQQDPLDQGYGFSSSSSGYSSSSTASTSGSGSFGNGLVRTSSNTSTGGAPSVGSSVSSGGRMMAGLFSSSKGGHHPERQHQHQQSQGGLGHRSNLSASSTGAGGLESDGGAGYYATPQGPSLGVPLRGALRSKNGVSVVGQGGVVFGKDLKTCVWESGVPVGKRVDGDEEREREEIAKRKEDPIRRLEDRALPALVVRCAQHLLLWGVQEEGLFRVPGRPSHTSTLRAEFDSGVDYDMTECSPADLDPHAVASVFKAYLRELPQPILTHKLQAQFDAAINKELALNASTAASANPTQPNRMSMRPGGPGLPATPKSGLPSSSSSGQPSLRKPPSLSTFAMPSFQGIPPPSKTLLTTLRRLIRELPTENRDLLRTVIELIQKTAEKSKETKMPLSNLMVVFCPSLGMSPPLLKVLCEAERMWEEDWEEVMDISLSGERVGLSDLPPPTPTKDNNRRMVVSDATTNDDYSDAQSGIGGGDEDVYDEASSGRTSLDNPSSDYHASAEGEPNEGSRPRGATWDHQRPDVPTVYLDSRSHCSSVSSVVLSEDQVGPPPLQTHSRHVRDGATTGSSNTSVSSSSGGYEFSVGTPTSSANNSFANLHAMGGDDKFCPLNKQQLKKKRSGPLIVDSTPLELMSSRSVISNPITLAVDSSVVSPRRPSPNSASNPSVQAKRRSIPILSLPTLATYKDTSDSPASSSPGSGYGTIPPIQTLKNKKPSLKLLFSKRSTSSLRSNGSSSGDHPYISPPLPQTSSGMGYHMREDTMYLQTPITDSSVSTPISAVTAPSSMGTRTSSSSSSRSPPVLDTPIENPSLSLGEFSVSPPTSGRSAIVGSRRDMESISPSKDNNNTDNRESVISVKTPVASRYRSASTNLPSAPMTTNTNWLRSQPSVSSLSLSMSLSSGSAGRLSLFGDGGEGGEEGDEEEEEEEGGWTRSVIMAAEARASVAGLVPISSDTTS